MEHFQSVYLASSQDNDILPDTQPANLDSMSPIYIDSTATERELMGIDTSKACGPDNLPGFILKSFATIMCSPMSCLFKRSLHVHVREGQFPAC